MTSDLERRDVRGQFSGGSFQADICAGTVWPRTIKFGTITYLGRTCIYWVSHASIQRGGAPEILSFCDPYVRWYHFTYSDQIHHRNSTTEQACLRLSSPKLKVKIFGTRRHRDFCEDHPATPRGRNQHVVLVDMRYIYWLSFSFLLTV